MGFTIPFNKKNGGERRLSAKERVDKAEAGFRALVEERKKLEQLILDSCIKLKDMDFVESTSGMKLENAQSFKDIMTFARGTPNLHIPLLESLDMDGYRYVRKYRSTEGIGHEIQLECAHTLRLGPEEKLPKKDQRVECPRCIAMLKERGSYKHQNEPE